MARKRKWQGDRRALVKNQPKEGETVPVTFDFGLAPKEMFIPTSSPEEAEKKLAEARSFLSERQPGQDFRDFGRTGRPEKVSETSINALKAAGVYISGPDTDLWNAVYKKIDPAKEPSSAVRKRALKAARFTIARAMTMIPMKALNIEPGDEETYVATVLAEHIKNQAMINYLSEKIAEEMRSGKLKPIRMKGGLKEELDLNERGFKIPAGSSFEDVSKAMSGDPETIAKYMQMQAESPDAMKQGIREEVRSIVEQTRAERHPNETLLDLAEFIESAQPRGLHKKHFRDTKISATRYVLDMDASRKVGEFLRSAGDLVIDHLEFARTPNVNTYVEVHSKELYAAWHPEVALSYWSDRKVGYLTGGEMNYILVDSTGQRGSLPAVCPHIFGWRKNRPQATPLAEIFGHSSQDSLNLLKTAWLFGGRRLKFLPPDYKGKTRQQLNITSTTQPKENDLVIDFSHFDEKDPEYLQLVAYEYDMVPLYRLNSTEPGLELAFLGSGDALIHAAIMLLLNQPGKIVTQHERPREISMAKGKRKVYPALREVHLHLTPRAAIRIIRQHHTGPKRRHNVRGVFHHYGGEQGWEACTHTWEPISEVRGANGDYKYYRCSTCSRRRTWVDEFERGDASIGYVEHYYKVHR